MGNRISGRKPVYSSDGNYQYDENGNKTDRYTISKGEREETQDTLWGWNVGAILAIFIPIFLLFIAQLIQSQNSGSRWRLWRGDDKGYVGLWIVYFWSLLLFIGMIWYGNRVALTDRASQNMRTLVGALFVFMCLCGMLCILVWAFAVSL